MYLHFVSHFRQRPKRELEGLFLKENCEKKYEGKIFLGYDAIAIIEKCKKTNLFNKKFFSRLFDFLLSLL